MRALHPPRQAHTAGPLAPALGGKKAAANDEGTACRVLRGRSNRVTTAVDGAAHGGCLALEDGAKEGVGGELPAPRGDEAGAPKVSLRLDRVGRDCDCARGQSHLSSAHLPAG